MPDNLPEDEKPLVRKVDDDKLEETKPVVWTPEDASRFLTSAIHESQRPLADALKQRPVTSKALAVMLTIIVAAAAVIGFILWSQMEKAEKRADLSQNQRDQALIERLQHEAKSVTLQDKLVDAQSKQDALNQRVDSLKGSEDALKRAQSDMAKYRRQAELLKGQIAGLEMEKAAIQRQMDAVRAMVIDHQNEGEVPEEPENPFERSPAQPEAMAAPSGEPRSLPLPVEAGTVKEAEPVKTAEPLITAEPVTTTEAVTTTEPVKTTESATTTEAVTTAEPAKDADAASHAVQDQAVKASIEPDKSDQPGEAEATRVSEPETVSEPEKSDPPEGKAVSLEKLPLVTAPAGEPSRPIPSPERFLAESISEPKTATAEPVPAENKQESAPPSTSESAPPTADPAVPAAPLPVTPPQPQPPVSGSAPVPHDSPPPDETPHSDYQDDEDNGPIKSTPIRLEDAPQLQVENVAHTQDKSVLSEQESAAIGNAVAAAHAEAAAEAGARGLEALDAGLAAEAEAMHRNEGIIAADQAEPATEAIGTTVPTQAAPTSQPEAAAALPDAKHPQPEAPQLDSGSREESFAATAEAYGDHLAHPETGQPAGNKPGDSASSPAAAANASESADSDGKSESDQTIDQAVQEIRKAVEDIKQHGDRVEDAVSNSIKDLGTTGPAAIGALKRDLDRKGQ